MGKGGGKGFDTSGMERATREGIALQERIYNEQKDMMQPWYRTGAASLGRLADLTGVRGGSVQTRDQLYSQLKPQFTTRQTVTNARTAPNFDEWLQANPQFAAGQKDLHLRRTQARPMYDAIFGTNLPQPEAQTTETVDTAALNKAIEEQLAGQGTPSDFGDLTRRFTMQDFQADPGYAFRQSEGQRAIERAMAARGKTFTPEAIRAMQELNQGLASEEFTNAFNRRNIENENIFNRLATLSGYGQAATGQLAGAGQNYASNVTNLNTSLANAQAAAMAAKASRPSMFSQLLGAGVQLGAAYLGR